MSNSKYLNAEDKNINALHLKIDALQAEASQIRATNARLTAALEYYASEKNWYQTNNNLHIYMTIGSLDTEGPNWIGGRAARIALAATGTEELAAIRGAMRDLDYIDGMRDKSISCQREGCTCTYDFARQALVALKKYFGGI